MAYYYQGIFGTVSVRLSFYFSQTADHYGSYLTACRDQTDCDESKTVSVPQRDFLEFNRDWNMPADAYTEYYLSLFRVCDILLEDRACILHGAAFAWRGRAFILTAPSGTGKTTQLKHWTSLYGDEIQVLNGDKPILKEEDGSIMVYPSPWKGKEGWGDDTVSAPLGGIIYLEQARSNRISGLAPRDAIMPVLPRILSTFEDETIALNACSLLDSILNRVPVFKLDNRGDPESAILTRDHLLKAISGM